MSEHLRKTIKPQNSLTIPSPIKFWTSFGNCIYESLKKREWKESEYDNDWDICWVEKETVHELFDKTHMTSNQKVNHFRNHYELTRKDLMIKNLKRYKRALEKEGKLEEAAAFNFFPTSYNLPLEYNMFCDEFKKTGHAIWIMKPIGKSQGKGIFLFKKLSQISEWKIDAKAKEEGAQVENYIVQRYIHNPLLIGGKKFDMRIYCLVTSYSPLVAYLYRDGFARFTHHRYSNSDITNTYVHLTNVAIQKHSENYDKKIGGKWDLRTLKLYLMSKYGTEKVGKCFMDIQFLIVRTLQSVQKVINNDKRCFELYGFDILLDSHLKPWVLEVNGSPSMTANTPQDCELKCGLLDDVFSIIDMEKLLTGQEEQVGGFDLICKGTPIQNDSNLNSSMLGCENNRVQQLKKLAKQLSQKGTVQTSRPPKEPQSSIETRRSINRDSLQPIGGLPLDPAISTKKMRSKSTGKPAVYPGGINVSASAKVPRNIFSQKTTLIPLPQEAKETREIREIKEGREVRERRNSSQNSRLRVYKGKAIDLPPMNNGLSGLNPSSNVTTTLANLNPLSQKVTPGVVADVLSNGSHGINSAASTASHTNSSEFSLKPNQQKVGHQNSLTSSLVMYPNKGLGGAVDSKGNGQVESVLAHLPEISSGKEKNDKNFLYAHWQTQDLINYNLSKQSSVEMKLREGFSRQLKMMGTMENKSELRSEDNTMANSGGLSKDQNSARETGSQVNSEINNE